MTERDLGWADLFTSARRWGSLAWTEGRLSEVLADWAGRAGEPAVAVSFAVRARAHAARAAVLLERLPELRELPVAEVLRPAMPGWAGSLDALAADGPAAVDRYASSLVTLRDAYRACAGAASAVAEPSARRELARLAGEVEAERSSLGMEGPTGWASIVDVLGPAGPG